MRRLIAQRAALLVVLLVVTSCGVRPSGVIPGEEAPDGESTTTVVFFVADGQLAPVQRDFRGANQALDQLTAGPSEQEQAEGVGTELPAGTTLRMDRQAPVPTVTVTADLQTLTRLAVNQIVCTVVSVKDAGVPGVSGGVTLAGAGTTLPAQFCGQ